MTLFSRSPWFRAWLLAVSLAVVGTLGGGLFHHKHARTAERRIEWALSAEAENFWLDMAADSNWTEQQYDDATRSFLKEAFDAEEKHEEARNLWFRVGGVAIGVIGALCPAAMFITSGWPFCRRAPRSA